MGSTCTYRETCAQMHMDLLFGMRDTEIVQEAELNCICCLKNKQVGALPPLQSHVYCIRCVLFTKTGVNLVASSGKQLLPHLSNRLSPAIPFVTLIQPTATIKQKANSSYKREFYFFKVMYSIHK